MLITISPAKKLDSCEQSLTTDSTVPEFLSDSRHLVKQLRAFSEKKLSKLMGISPKLAAINVERFAEWKTPFTEQNAKQAVLLFKGDVYVGLDAEAFKARDFAYAQDHLRILSGLYGLLRPLDLIQPYRLEMGTQLKNERGKNLYEFWGSKMTDALNTCLRTQKEKVLINLASQEYSKSIHEEDIDGRILTPVFKDKKNGQYKVLSFFAKKARGLMVSYIIRKRIKKADDLKSFAESGYRFHPDMSSEDNWVFARDAA